MPVVHHSHYSATKFNGLPSLGEAEDEAKKIGLKSILDTRELGLIFVKHQVHTDLAVQLLHIHNRLAEDEQLVDVRGVSIPWKLNSIPIFDGRITPTSWMFEEDHYRPYEFKFVPYGEPLIRTHLPSEFLEEFNEYLKAKKLQHIIGLTVRSENAQLEFTQGLVNVSLDRALTTGFGEEVVAGWIFNDSGYGIGHIACLSYMFAHRNVGGPYPK
jgi:hypothetical protein